MNYVTPTEDIAIMRIDRKAQMLPLLYGFLFCSLLCLHFGAPTAMAQSDAWKPVWSDEFDGIDFTQDFHVYGIEWEPGEFRWLLDGQVWQIQKEWGTENGKFPQPFDQPFHLVFNLAVGGQFVGAVAEQTPFPAKLLVDWVRVSQR